MLGFEAFLVLLLVRGPFEARSTHVVFDFVA